MSTVLEEFIVSLTCKVDRQSFQNFNLQLIQCQKAMSELNKQAVFLKKSFNDLGNAKVNVKLKGIVEQKKGLEETNKTLDKTGKSMETLAKKSHNLSIASRNLRGVAIGLATGFGALTGIMAIGSHYSKRFFEARNTMSTVTGMNSLFYAIKQMGGTENGAKASLTAFSNFLQFKGPGAENSLKQIFKPYGFKTRDKNGKLRDTADLLTDVFASLANMPKYRAKAYAGLYGIDDNTLLAGMANVNQLRGYEGEYRSIFNTIGINPDQAAKDSQMLMTQYRRLMLAIEAIGERIAVTLIHAFGGKDLNDFTNYLLSNSQSIADGVANIAHWATTAMGSLISIGESINKIVQSTIGWKVAIEGIVAIFVGSKILKVIAGILSIARMLGFLAGGAIGGTIGTAALVGGGAYLAYHYRDDIYNTLFPSANGYSGIKESLMSKKMIQRQLYGMNFFTSKGLSAEASAGILGNLAQESQLGFNMGNDPNALGIAQWDRTRANDIKTRFGIDVKNAPYPLQLQAVYDEMVAGNDKGARKAYSYLMNVKNSKQASDIVEQYFERPKDAYGGEKYIRGISSGTILSNASHFKQLAYSPQQVNNINVTVHGSGDSHQIANAIVSRAKQEWQNMNTGNPIPIQLATGSH